MSENKEDFALHCLVKNEEARKRLGIKAGFFWTTAKKLSVAISRCIAAMDDRGYDEDDFKKPVRVNLPAIGDLPPEGVFDTEFCNRYEKGGEDGKTMMLIPGAVPADQFHEQMAADDDASSDTASMDTPADSDNTAGDPLPAYAYNVNGEPMADVEKSMFHPVATLSERHRILSQFILEDKFSHQITPEQLAEVSRMELEMSDNYIQDMLLACHNVPGIQKLDTPGLWKFTDAFKRIFPRDKQHTLHMKINFAQAYADAHPIDRGLLVKEWQKGNRVSSINRTPSGANAGGGILTDRGEGVIHDKVSLARDVAMGVLARSMDLDIYNLHQAHSKRVDEIVADNKPPFDVFCKAFLNMPDGMDYSRAIVVASVKEAPIGIEAIPARVTEYLNRVLTETDHANPDPLIVDIACGRTSQPMPVKGSANDDEEKPQPAGELADEPATPEAVEQDTTEHHPDPQPLENEPPVSQTEAGYQKIRAELHEARKNIPPKNPVDVGKQLAAARGEYVEGISDPNDPKWVHNNYSASNQGEKEEVVPEEKQPAAEPEAVTRNADGTFDVSALFPPPSNQTEKTEARTERDGETPKESNQQETAGDTGQEITTDGGSGTGGDEAGEAADPVENGNFTVPDDIQPGIYYDIPNEAYHAGPGVSKSQLDDIADTPAIYLWRKNAPVDTEKTKSLDTGTAFHCRILEPEEFSKRFIIAPEFNRRTSAGKEEEKTFLEECARTGRTVLTAEEGRKIELMYQSVMALPLGQWLVESAGYAESSVYWEDPETGILCRCRPDKIIPEFHWIMDVKTTADIQRFRTAYYDYRYHVQDAFYSDGYRAQFGEIPTFVFLVASTTAECGRYPVEIFMMGEDAKLAGQREYRRNLQTLAECLNNDEWPAIKTLSLPRWAKENANA
ncbi:exodeoxyribonuclease VIII [Salmonella enterica subsp. houtenae serovar 44:z4,z23:-]|uniref:Exodeoxyribonuclease VIII n=5 Tax=Salmonella enterica TaxID=28901 RepID=A0A5U2RHX7_SALER|nr:exodeoxyribonuclease VIII [Salmonella enterica]EBQ4846936.1 exodeoxyribonuclease VIII [Salmonella enterica subsp. salamae]EBX5128856.1 exodeoxyribonuclease VIII [Salmonella enterica subsp. enterica serovar Hvittingfoss]ECD3157063.1 exodeoxyribonuclease VIII [Salmonella enterica subsp. enterica serovar Monschaui]ECD5876671.1 exodeoxyribonuclease VIII [Salmonella enterica subsp. enterica serovar Poona]ECF3486835.1 exodeoxyribonuclease VIII [Salmonella enterica subsp. enterica serovar Cotham]